MRRPYEIRKAAADDTLFCIVKERLRNFPFIQEPLTEEDIAKLVRRKRYLENTHTFQGKRVENKMVKKEKIALYISALMNAPLITLGTFLPLIIKYENSDVWLLIGITSLFGCFLPIGMVIVFLKKDYITDFYANDKSERFIPFLTTILSYLFGVLTLFLVKSPAQITALMACYFGNGIILALITLKWKISIHSSGITGPITSLVYLLGYKFLPLFLLVIPVIWARLELKAHSMLELTTGALLTIFLTWFQMEYYLSIICT